MKTVLFLLQNAKKRNEYEKQRKLWRVDTNGNFGKQYNFGKNLGEGARLPPLRPLWRGKVIPLKQFPSISTHFEDIS